MARIAYASSHVILSVQPALGTDSEFSRQLHTLALKRTPGIVAREPEVNCTIRILGKQSLTPILGASNKT